ncbi:TonB-linked outer membrane protein, SusC/RagA family [Bacteroides luti]|uniref:TonB-linked outer membrane protein, SusC/RagA family n=1 Tax=Bacteroides luti TaxID=1297750 RepID=A0A1M5GZZ4_9BACE|nr:TonB-dependent receptor [Bacteroides luti]SHG09225.1 TonB-linked outer membrane protein, SusC/RagA family [Bacteroides luti]
MIRTITTTKKKRDFSDFIRLKLVFLFVSLSTFTTYAQITLKGTILDERSKKSVFGASIKLKGQLGETFTDVDGAFQLKVKALPATLSVKSIGYKPQEFDIYEAEPITIYLNEDLNELDNVVVTGYVQTKRNAKTSAISEIKADQLKNIAGTGLNEQIQGQTPGLLVSTTSGTPGSSVFVRLRGTTSINAGNDPLYVIDGVPISSKTLQTISIGGQTTNPLSDINPADIESVEVLKDANATAVYGARGANGVILITTKRGKNNSKTKISLDAEYGFSKAAKLWDLATGPDHAQILNEAWVNDGKSYATRPYRPKEEGGLGNPEDQKTYDRQSLVFRTANVQTYNISANGGDAKTSFFIGGGFTSQEAIVKTQDFSRYNFRVNLDHKINNKLSIGTSNSLDYSIRSLSRTANSPKGILQASVHTATLLPIYNEDGSYAKYGIFDNIVALIKNNDHHAYGLHSINNVYAKWNIKENLSFKSSVSADLNNYHEKRYFNTQLSDGQPNGAATDATSIEQTWVAEQLLNYFTTIRNSHFISLFLGNTVQKRNYQQESINASSFPSDQFKTISSAAITSATTSSSSSGLVSFFGGANYSFNNKYSVDANLRADASSRFGKSNRWAYFPSVGASWRVSQENFIKNLNLFNELKLKASLGWTGNQDIDDFASLGLWSGGANYGNSAGISSSQLSNPDLKWETTRQWNVGLESSFLAGRLSFELNYYNKYTSDLLLNVPIAGKTGFSSTIQNVGAMSNKGVEFEINSTNIDTRDFKWTSSFQISHNENLVEKLPISFSQYSRDWVRLQQGSPMYSFWLYKQLYVDPKTGNAVYEDVNKDGKITTADRQIVGDAWPTFTGGLRNTLTYKGFDLSVFLYFSVGNDVFNMNRFFQEHGGVRGTNWGLLKSQMKRWQKEGDITDIPRASTVVNPDGSYNNDFQSSRFLEDGSFLRLRNLTIGYTLSPKALVKAGLSKIRLYASATNLFTITKYSGADPEGNTAADQTNGTVQGLDFAIPPQPRQIVFGANLTF